MTARRPALETRTRHALETRVGAHVGAGLTQRAAELPHDISERLRVAREQAVTRAREVLRPQAQRASAVVIVGSGSAALGGPPVSMWQRAAAFLPLALVVLGLLMIQRQAELEQVQAAAEVDAQLLSDDLPPDAYADPGFAEFMRRSDP